MLRILHTADWHLRHKHKYTKVVNGKIWDVMFEEKIKALKYLPKIADKYKCDMVLIAGDIFDTTNPPEAIKAEFVKIINSFSKDIVYPTPLLKKERQQHPRHKQL